MPKAKLSKIESGRKPTYHDEKGQSELGVTDLTMDLGKWTPTKKMLREYLLHNVPRDCRGRVIEAMRKYKRLPISILAAILGAWEKDLSYIVNHHLIMYSVVNRQYLYEPSQVEWCLREYPPSSSR